jgi:hypothetical protein
VSGTAFVLAILLNVACCQQAKRSEPKPTRHPLDFPEEAIVPPQVPSEAIPENPYDKWQEIGPDDIVYGIPLNDIEKLPPFTSFDFKYVDCAP